MFTLPVEKRDSKTNLNELRITGKLPAIFYGPKEKSTSITVPMNEFIKAPRKRSN